jgi:hypothetical protein
MRRIGLSRRKANKHNGPMFLGRFSRRGVLTATCHYFQLISEFYPA